MNDASVPAAIRLKQVIRKMKVPGDIMQAAEQGRVFVVEPIKDWHEIEPPATNQLPLPTILVQSVTERAGIKATVVYLAGQAPQFPDLCCMTVFMEIAGRFLPVGLDFQIKMKEQEFAADWMEGHPRAREDVPMAECEKIVTHFLALVSAIQNIRSTVRPQVVPASKRSLSRVGKLSGSWEYKVVNLPNEDCERGADQAGTHAPPRWHVRRGHWRHLRSGKQVWVRHCEVGSKDRGGVVHDYSVAVH